jgi:hypothetical protein
MKVVKLNSEHAALSAGLFQLPSYFSPLKNTCDSENFESYARCGYGIMTHGILCDNYLNSAVHLDNFHAYGLVDDTRIVTMICFYESASEPAWYLTAWRNYGRAEQFAQVLDAVLAHNEANHRYKFYSLEAPQHADRFRAEYCVSDVAKYEHVEEFRVDTKNQCCWSNYWELLYKRVLVAEATVVTCYYKMQKFRTSIPSGGSL